MSGFLGSAGFFSGSATTPGHTSAEDAANAAGASSASAASSASSASASAAAALAASVAAAPGIAAGAAVAAAANVTLSANSLPTVADRPPTPTDGTSAGYTVGSIWRNKDGTYQLIRDTAGKANWQAMGSLAVGLPLDNVTGALAAYGMMRLRAAYTGPCISVQRLSDNATLNIGFVNNDLDVATLDAFLLGTTGAVLTWYDQTGNGRHATAVLASAPHLNSASLIGKARSLVFDNQYTGTFSPAVSMAVPSSVTTTWSSSSLITFVRSKSSLYANNIAEFSNGAGNSIALARLLYTYNVGVVTGGGGYSNSAAYSSVTPYVTGYLASGSAFTTWKDDAFSTGGTTGNNTTLAGGYLGAAPSVNTNTGFVEFGAAIFYGRGIADTERTTLTAGLHTLFGTIPQSRSNVTQDGDSIAEGSHDSALMNIPRQGEPLLRRPCRVANVGNSGDTAAGRLGNFAGATAPHYISGGLDNIFTLAVGTNDLGQNVAVSSITSSLVAYGAAVHALSGAKFITATILPRQNHTSAQDAQRLVLNAWIRANWQTYADALADYDADPTMGGAQSQANNGLLYADGTHPTRLGYSYLAPIWAAAVNSVLNVGSIPLVVPNAAIPSTGGNLLGTSGVAGIAQAVTLGAGLTLSGGALTTTLNPNNTSLTGTTSMQAASVSGTTTTGKINFTGTGATAADFSHQIDLYQGQYGINTTAGSLNVGFPTGSAFVANCNGTPVFSFGGASAVIGIPTTHYGTVTMGNGIAFTSGVVTATDLSTQINLYGGTYGFNTTSGAINSVGPTGASFNSYAGGTLVCSISAGGVVSSGKVTAAGFVASGGGASTTTDLSHHLDLYSGQYGLNTTGGRLNVVVPSGGAIIDVVNGVDVMATSSTGVAITGTLSATGCAYIEGLSFASGSGAPSATTVNGITGATAGTPAVGSRYVNTAGAAGARVYWFFGGAWVAQSTP